jgi:hypothetical protein
MPTGYTAMLNDEDVTFPAFAMECARAFGALILMRDDPKGTPIPDEFQPNTSYYDESQAAAEARLAELRAMTPEDIVQANQEERADVLEQRARSTMERRDLRLRYEAMLAEVQAWEPPTEDHQGLKDFMAEQITSSIKFDCTPISYPEMPASDPAEWFEAQVAKCERDIAYAEERRAEEIERVAQRNGWVRALRESLAPADA